MDSSGVGSECPICCKTNIPKDKIEAHVNQCIFLHTTEDTGAAAAKEPKRSFGLASGSPIGTQKKPRLSSKAAPSNRKTSTVTSGASVFASPKEAASSVVLSSESDDGDDTPTQKSNVSAGGPGVEQHKMEVILKSFFFRLG